MEYGECAGTGSKLILPTENKKSKLSHKVVYKIPSANGRQ